MTLACGSIALNAMITQALAAGLGMLVFLRGQHGIAREAVIEEGSLR